MTKDQGNQVQNQTPDQDNENLMNIKDSNEQSLRFVRTILKHKLLAIFAITNLLLIAGVIGYNLFPKIGTVSKYCHLEYISQDELISLERKRIALTPSNAKDDKSQSIFYGDAKEAIKIISRLASTRQTRNNKVLLTSGLIQSDNVKSITKEVYEQVIKELNKKQNEASK